MRSAFSHPRSPQQRVASRFGTATVELAVCLPLLMLLLMGSIEMSNLAYLKQTLEVAAYEGIRAGTSPGGTQEKALDRCEEVLTSREIAGYTINVTPTIDENTPAGELITITVTAPANANSIAPQWFTKDATVEGAASMSRL